MKCVPTGICVPCVHLFAREWAAKFSHVNADLVRPTGLKLHLERTVRIRVRNHSVLCDRQFTVLRLWRQRIRITSSHIKATPLRASTTTTRVAK